MKWLTNIMWILFSLLVIVIGQAVTGRAENAKPERVRRIVYEIKPNEWYVEQAELWKKEINKNPKNADAWYNYYNAVRYADFAGKIRFSEDKKTKLNKIIEDMGKAIPNTYEYYIVKYWDCYDIHDISLLEEAHKLRPDRPDPYYPFITHYELNGKENRVKEYCRKLYESEDIAPWLIDYNYNVLMSTEEGAVLFTNGDNDTYPCWILQNVHGVRQDVTILNIPLAPTESYLERKLKKKGISCDYKELKQKAFIGGPKKPSQFSPGKYVQELTKILAESFPEIPVYFALTVYGNHIEDIKDDLYIVGLAYQYSPDRVDNLAILKKNFEKRFRLDYLEYDWYSENFLGTSIRNRMHMNYVPPLIMLAEHYKTSGEEDKAGEWKRFTLDIVEKTGDMKMMKNVMKTFEEIGLSY